MSILNNLIHNPDKFSFIKAIDIILASNKDYSLNSIKIKSKINFQSKFYDVHSVKDIKSNTPKITVNIEGIAAYFPDPYIENYVLYNRETKKEVSEFYDILNSRFMVLRYTFYKKHVIPCLSFPIQKTSIGRIITNLSGINKNLPALIAEQFKIAAQNLFWKNARSAESLRIIISSFFNLDDVEVEQFVGGFTKSVSSQYLTKIGKNFNVLGTDTILGNKTWNSMKGIAINIKFTDVQKYMKFLPKISKKDQKFSSLEKLKELIRLYVPFGIHVKITFCLAASSNMGTWLNHTRRLNKDAFINGNHNFKKTYFIEYL